MSKKLTTQEFIEKSKLIHGDKYDYSLVNYIKNRLSVKIICKEHGIFQQMAANHLSGSGCFECNGTKKYSNDTFIKKSQSIHGDKYDYLKINYKDNDSKVIITCKAHGDFIQKAGIHLNGSGCPTCMKRNKLNTQEFIKRSKELYGDIFTYNKSIYISVRKNIKITCKKHGDFDRKVKTHFQGSGCPKCPARSSKGEITIKRWLEIKNIKYLPQYTFNNCRNRNILPFDFYLPDYNTCIEYNGEQHYKPIDFFGGEKRVKKHLFTDNIKKEYCYNNDIPLIIIKYNENINEILNEKLLLPTNYFL